MLPDVGTPRPDEADRIGQWIESGGVAVRFAGPLLAAHPDALVPVPLRAGDRVLSGALSWSEPDARAPFSGTSSFAGMAVPPDVRIPLQVLAVPPLALADNTLAALPYGRPHVTAHQRGSSRL